tara:strand:- start:6 stop:608 length:603 start_codon:yes stop_codon:yes gene_type:complete
MKTLEIQLFKFDELSKEAKENSIQNYIEKNRSFLQEINSEMFYEDLPYNLEIKEPLFENPKFQYSLSYCQGDGLSFSFDIDILDYLNKYFPKLKDSVKNVISEYCTFSANGNNGRYCYAHKNQIDLCLDIYNNGRYDNLEGVINEVLEHIQDNYLEICSKLENEGYNNIYEWENDKDYILNEIYNSEEFEPIFLSTGEIY